MADITKIPRDELITDLVDSIEDIEVCDFALDQEITRYPSGVVWPRLKGNERFIQVIIAELRRRKREEIESGEALIAPLLAQGGPVGQIRDIICIADFNLHHDI